MKLLLKYLLFFVVLQIYLSQIKARVILTNDFAKLVKYDPELIDMKSFEFYKKRRNLSALNVTFETFHEINDKTSQLTVSASTFRNAQYRSTGIQFTMGICVALLTKAYDVFKLIENTNMTRNCPFPKGVYYINDIAPTENILPKYFPEGKFMIEFTFTKWGKVMAQIQWMITVSKEL